LSQEARKKPFKEFIEDIKLMLFMAPITGVKPKDIITQSSNITQKLIGELKNAMPQEKKEIKCSGIKKLPLK
jgi:hypothetical protein